jgi:hypothetical protein
VGDGLRRLDAHGGPAEFPIVAVDDLQRGNLRSPARMTCQLDLDLAYRQLEELPKSIRHLNYATAWRSVRLRSEFG